MWGFFSGSVNINTTQMLDAKTISDRTFNRQSGTIKSSDAIIILFTHVFKVYNIFEIKITK
jgi:hypothetical protein